MHLLSFLRGAAFGGLLVYLFAPRSGAETRKMLADRGNDMKKLVSDDMLDFTGEEAKKSSHSLSSANSNGNIYNPETLKEL